MILRRVQMQKSTRLGIARAVTTSSAKPPIVRPVAAAMTARGGFAGKAVQHGAECAPAGPPWPHLMSRDDEDA